MKRKPAILIAPAHDIDPAFHCQQYMVNNTYPLAVVAGGGIPLLAVDPSLFEEYTKIADGLVMVGSMPVHPDNFLSGKFTREDQSKYIKGTREPFDLGIYKAFRDAGKPVLGICLGHQMINVAQGGTLNPKAIPVVFGTEHGSSIAHTVKAEPGSVLAKLFGEEFLVNSRHRFFVDKLGEGIKITAWSEEGVPEALEHDTLPIIGVQWHPERGRGEFADPPYGADMTKLFEYFVNLCKQYQA